MMNPKAPWQKCVRCGQFCTAFGITLLVPLVTMLVYVQVHERQPTAAGPNLDLIDIIFVLYLPIGLLGLVSAMLGITIYVFAKWRGRNTSE